MKTHPRLKKPAARHAVIDRLSLALDRAGIWPAFVLSGIYLAVMGYYTLHDHTVGFFGVETDFYAEFARQARLLLRGDFSPANYWLRGPVYSLLLAGLSLSVWDLFTTGLVLNLISGAVFLIVLYLLVGRVFNRLTALVVMAATAVNPSFITYTYQAGTDLPFMALAAGTMLALFGSDRRWAIALSAVLGLLTFLTRYNGAFVVAGAAVFFAVSEGSRRDRLTRLGLWLGVFILAGLPWFIPNTIVQGSPVYNTNYQNILIEFYGTGPGGVFDEARFSNLMNQYHGTLAIVMHDPVYFVRHYLVNIGATFLNDLRQLVGIPLAVPVVIGFLLLPFARPNRRKLAYLSFGAALLMILSLVFYNPRFSLFQLMIYLPFAVWPWTIPAVGTRLRRITPAVLGAFCLIIGAYGYTTARTVIPEIPTPPPIEALRTMGLDLAGKEPDLTQKIAARRPHISYYADLVPIMFPEDAGTVEELITFCRENRVRYVAYTVFELQTRPRLQTLIDPGQPHAGLEPVIVTNIGVIYRVTGI